jgi:hypothetical protein
MRSWQLYALVVLVFVALVGSAVYISGHGSRLAGVAHSSITATHANEYSAPPLTHIYQNDEYRFSLSTPDGFTTQEMPNDTSHGKTITLQNLQGDGIQIKVSPFLEDLHVLTADRVHADIPDMQITDVQPVEIGSNHTGIAFKSNNDAFGGASREVWFVFRGNLYQISTYARLDPLLQAMFGTWKFY